MVSAFASTWIGFAKAFLLCLALESNGAAPQPLVSAANELQKHLTALPEPSRSDWKTYLSWDKWGEDLAQSRLPEREILESVTHRFYGVREGLEHPAMVTMRSELTRLLKHGAMHEAAASHPALLIRANPSLITDELAKFSRTRQDHRDMGAWIAGAWVTGKAHSDANVTAQLVPYQDAAAIEVRVRGTIDSPHTIARSGAFEVHGSAKSQLEGVSYLYLDGMQVRATEPRFSARTDSSVSHVDGPKPLRGIAKRKAHKKQDEGESEGARLVASQATEELQKELDVEVRKANAELSEQGKYPILMKRTDLAPTLIKTGLSSGAVQVGFGFPGAGADQLPNLGELSPQTPLEVSMHESLLAAFAANFVRGSTWTDADFSRMQRELTGTNANEMLIGATPHRWSARWDWDEPIQVKVTPEGLHYQLQFSRARIDDREINASFSVKASYQPVSKRWGIEFHRIGTTDIRIIHPNHSFSDKDAQFVAQKFSALFGEIVFLDGLSPPHGGGWDGLAAFAISGVRLQPGWMIISSRQAPTPPIAISK